MIIRKNKTKATPFTPAKNQTSLQKQIILKRADKIVQIHTN